jgi:peptidoglycan/xylan/chitin deacetylase (PgdA/CDA1 family)
MQHSPSVSQLDVHFRVQMPRQARAYLTERDLEIRFSALHKAYYSILRPIVPLPMRRAMQRGVSHRCQRLPDFIWPDLVDLMKADAGGWGRFCASIHPNGRRTSIVLTHDVESQQGYDFIPEVIALERKYGFRSSWNLVADLYDIRADIVDQIRTAGHEIGIHGDNHDGKLYYSYRGFRQRQRLINDSLKKYGAVGFRSPQMHRNLAWLQDLDVDYDMSCFDYDPYQPFPGGTGSIWPFMAGRLVELPYTVPQDHTLFEVLGQSDASIWRRKSEWLVANHGMILVLTHPDYLMRRGRLECYEEYLDYLSKVPDSWHGLPSELARHVRSLPPPIVPLREANGHALGANLRSIAGLFLAGLKASLLVAAGAES